MSFNIKEADFVVVFDYSVLDSVKTVRKKLVDTVEIFAKAGFYIEIRKGFEDKSLFIFIKCSDSRLIFERCKIFGNDWCKGLSVIKYSDSITEKAKNEIISKSERLRIVNTIISSPKDDLNVSGLGITPGIGEWIFISNIFIPHDKEYDIKWIHKWATEWLIKKEDLLELRNNFGEKVAIYFAFLQSYFVWTSIPAFFGVLAYFFIEKNFSIYIAIINSIWGILFIEYWSRREKLLAFEWQTRHCSRAQTRLATFKPIKNIKDSITGESIPYYPYWKRLLKQLIAIPLSLSAALILVSLQCFIFFIEIFIGEIYNGPLKSFLIYLPMILISCIVPTFSTIYNIIVNKIVIWENHEFQNSFERSRIGKAFVINFLVSYSGLLFTSYVYIPFGNKLFSSSSTFLQLMERFIIKNHSTYDIKMNSNFQVNSARLSKQYFSLLVTGQVVNFFLETILPSLQRKVVSLAKRMFKRDSEEDKKNVSNGNNNSSSFPDSADEKDFLNAVRKECEFPIYNTSDDYCEMIIQFGYIVLFGPVWPLAPLMAFINNWFELRGDAAKICIDMKRPTPERAESIGPWLVNLRILVWIGSIVSFSLVAMFSESNDLPGLQSGLHSSGDVVKRNSWIVLLVVLLSEHLHFVFYKLVEFISKRFFVSQDTIEAKQVYVYRRSVLDDHYKFKRDSTFNDLSFSEDNVARQVRMGLEMSEHKKAK